MTEKRGKSAKKRISRGEKGWVADHLKETRGKKGSQVVLLGKHMKMCTKKKAYHSEGGGTSWGKKGSEAIKEKNEKGRRKNPPLQGEKNPFSSKSEGGKKEIDI